MTPPEFSIERLASEHDRRSFECGVPPLDTWLKNLASQFEKRDLARVYVAVEPGVRRVLGYYAISSHAVSFEDLSREQAKGLPRIDLPVILLGRLAVDRSAQGQGLGALLLIDALRRAQSLAELLGVQAVEVDAYDQNAREFYLKFGFTPFADSPQHLFLPMRVIRLLRLPPR